MANSEKNLDRLYVASPCSADWEAMPGNAQVRFCNQCQLNVYNISAMTRKQAEALIASTEGRLCTKLYRRADGTIITQDCPKRLQAVKRRVSRIASATLSTLLGLFTNQTIGWADDGHKNCVHYTTKVIRLQSQENVVMVVGTISDVTKAVIVNAAVTLVNEETKREYVVKTDQEGKYNISSLQAGKYEIAVTSPGFVKFSKKNLEIKTNEALQINVMLQVGTTGGAAFLPALLEKEKGIEIVS